MCLSFFLINDNVTDCIYINTCRFYFLFAFFKDTVNVTETAPNNRTACE